MTSFMDVPLLGPYLMESDEAAGLSPSTQQYPLGIGTSRKEYLSFLIISPSKPMIRFIICLSGSLYEKKMENNNNTKKVGCFKMGTYLYEI